MQDTVPNGHDMGRCLCPHRKRRSVLLDSEKGEMVCSKCGIVLQEMIEEPRRAADHGSGNDPEGMLAQGGDIVLGGVGIHKSDAAFKDSDGISKMSRVVMNGGKERREFMAYHMTEKVLVSIGATRTVRHRAHYLRRKVMGCKTGLRNSVLAVICVREAAREMGTMIPLGTMLQMHGITYGIYNQYKWEFMDVINTSCRHVENDITRIIAMICSKLDLPVSVASAAKSLYESKSGTGGLSRQQPAHARFISGVRRPAALRDKAQNCADSCCRQRHVQRHTADVTQA